jgi:hypothetical protein
VFDIDATTGALASPTEIQIPEIGVGEALAYSGNVLAVTGSNTSKDEEIFQRAVIDKSSGVPVFESFPDAPCPMHFCDDGQLYMLDSEHMLGANLVLDPNSSPADEIFIDGVSANDVGGGWTELGSAATERAGPSEITADGHEYFALEHQTESEALEKEETFTGEQLFEAFDVDGFSEGFTVLPAKSGATGILSLGSGLYIANGSADGLAYRLSSGKPPALAGVNGALGSAMTGFLTGGDAEEPGPGGSGEGSGKSPAAGTETPAGASVAGSQLKGPGGAIKAISFSGVASSVKLKGGVIKLDVDCAQPCTVSGQLLVPGAKAASAGKPKSLPFKSVELAGSGEPVPVTLRFTAAQKKLAASDLRKHKKVTAKITVTEAPGGAAPSSKTIRIR